MGKGMETEKPVPGYLPFVKSKSHGQNVPVAFQIPACNCVTPWP